MFTVAAKIRSKVRAKVEKILSDGIVIDEQNNGTARTISFLYISLALDAKQ